MRRGGGGDGGLSVSDGDHQVDLGVSDVGSGGSGDCVEGGGDCVKGGGGLDKTELLLVRWEDCHHMHLLVTGEDTALRCMLYVLGT